MSYANTLAYLANKRPCANPNFGFRMQLIKYAEKKACVERLRLQNRFGVKCCQLQQIEDEAALSKSGIVALPILCKTQSEKTLPDVAPLLSSAVPLSHREAAEDRGICRRVTHKKAASSDCLLSSPRKVKPCDVAFKKVLYSDCLLSSPRKVKPCDVAFVWRISDLAYIDQ
uniref:Tyrosine-protein phosphatase domain-containing protein n=1 Tax=Ascaris lumbricoides TaxID=6252 RepID=A0A0M3IKC8_ASCLU